MKGCDIFFEMTEKSESVALSVAIITLNEEFNIARAIRSVGWAAEVVIYDSGSKDKTIEIAQKMGAKVVQGPWLGFGPSKRKVTEAASYDWILSIDADEEVPEALATEIRQKWSALQPQRAYQIPRLSKYLGKWIKYGGWYPDHQTRLFHRQYSNWDNAEIHEKVQAQELGRLTQPFHHYVFKNIEHQVQTNNRYSSLQAQEMHRKGKDFSWFHFFTKPYVKFIECYFLKLGLLDGWPGYVIARNAGYSVFMKWSKLRELSMKEVEK